MPVIGSRPQEVCKTRNCSHIAFISQHWLWLVDCSYGVSQGVHTSSHAWKWWLITTETAVTLAVQKLHGAGLVHGDLQSPNILWKDGQVKFIDFDWAGVNGDTTYPTSMNPNINWAPGVGLCKHIKPEHDIYMVESIYKKVSHTKQNLSEWNPLYIIKHYQHTWYMGLRYSDCKGTCLIAF